MRVLFLTYHFPEPDQPGAFRPWVEACALRDLGCDVTVVTSATHYMTGEDQRHTRAWCEEHQRDGIRILKTWAPSAYRRKIRSRLLNYVAYGVGAFLAGLLRGGPADFVFAGTDPVSTGPAAYLLSRLKRARLVLDERDLYPETAIALGVIKDGRFSRLVFRLQNFWRRRATGILAATPGIARALTAYGHPNEKISIMMNVDPYLEKEGLVHMQDVDDLHELSSYRFVVAYSGGLGRNNDVSTLLKAAELLKDEPEIGFVVVGEGEWRARYDDFCRERRLANVWLPGPRPREEVRALLASADACACLYHAGELFKGTLASKIFDYLAAGKPVVFAGSGDTAALLEQAGAAIIVPPADAAAVAAAIRKLYSEPDLRARLGASGQRWYQDNVSVTAVGETLTRVFDLTRSARVRSAGL